ncbi:hypothetical protein A2960_06575 [Candidatus Gottesmanbacteria bacterium RIFCSPLOWO2_01_FULL_39_12b]|uniref:Uncharacterized protein n=1 Tax=Candidatus Gottesmanbacteria bacterium RIFCSPLOWO2_01_FULL_39_12b TaxID=1798388 RepID=A0A1F6ARY4_9BACT|nr:MAG: hypothetical protein A2960_06575 [Candidatus Gottesmanbacteria bacterium RIFCSPLOWO2_01_FULL_39_12b]
MSYQEARSHLRDAVRVCGTADGACVPFALECILPPSIQLNRNVYEKCIRNGGDDELRILTELTRRGLITFIPLCVTIANFQDMATHVSRQLNLIDTVGALCCIVNYDELHLISLQGPLEGGYATVFDLGNEYQEQPITILYSVVGANEYGVSDNLTIVSKGPNWPG